MKSDALLTGSPSMRLRAAAHDQKHAFGPVQRHFRARKSARSIGLLCTAFAGPQAPSRGASGLDVQGLRPTSPAAWKIVVQVLRQQKVKMMAPQELGFTTNKSLKIIDIRPPKDFEEAHIDSAVNVPLYRPITGWDPRRVARRIGFAFFGVLNGTEVNPNFFADIMKNVDNENGTLFVCNQGGSLEASKGSGQGTQSRSLMAAYEALQLGAEKVSVLKGGFAGWRRKGRPYVNMQGESLRDETASDDE